MVPVRHKPVRRRCPDPGHLAFADGCGPSLVVTSGNNVMSVNESLSDKNLRTAQMVRSGQGQGEAIEDWGADLIAHTPAELLRWLGV